MSLKDTMKNSTGLAAAMSALGATSAEVKAAGDALVDLELGKAFHSETLKPGEQVEDTWNQGERHRVPGSDRIKTGPAEHASGAGVDKMVGEYSRPAPQHGIQVEAEQLARELGSFRGYMKSIHDVVVAFGKGQNALTNVVTAMLTASAENNAEPAQLARFGEGQARTAEGHLRTAKAMLSKAAHISDGADDLEGEAKSAAKAQLRVLRKEAARYALKALIASYAVKSDDADPALAVRKAVVELAEGNAVLKADMDALHDKEKDKDHEKSAKKSIKAIARKAARKAAAKVAKKAAKAASATAAATGAGAGAGEGAVAGGGEKVASNQADKQDKDIKNQDDSATSKKSEVDADMLTKALQGFGMLEGSIKQVLDIVSGRAVSTKATEPLELLKSDPAQTFLGINQKIDEAVQAERLDSAGEGKARDLLQKLDAVSKGVLPEGMWKDLLRGSPTVVRDIFTDVRAAA